MGFGWIEGGLGLVQGKFRAVWFVFGGFGPGKGMEGQRPSPGKEGAFGLSLGTPKIKQGLASIWLPSPAKKKTNSQEPRPKDQGKPLT